MATEKQIAANRQNALLSTGPSEEGKKISRMNALRHGLTGQIDVTTPEEKEAKDKFFSDIISTFAPANPVEHQFAHAIADGHWRLNRASTIENNMFTLACSFQAETARNIPLDDNPDLQDPEVVKALDAARVFIADSKRFNLLTIYEGRIHRTMQKNLQSLRDLQATRRAEEAERKTRREEALEQARLLTQLAEMEGVPCDIATDYPQLIGFVLSPAEIAQSIRLATRLKAAKRAESLDWKPSIRLAA